jgi:hypothetical protein
MDVPPSQPTAAVKHGNDRRSYWSGINDFHRPMFGQFGFRRFDESFGVGLGSFRTFAERVHEGIECSNILFDILR